MSHAYMTDIDYKEVEFERKDLITGNVILLKYPNGGRFQCRDFKVEKEDHKGDLFIIKNKDGSDGSIFSLNSTCYEHTVTLLVLEDESEIK